VRRKKEYGPTDVGKELTAAAISCMQELFSFTHLRAPASGIRHYLGDDTADILGVPRRLDALVLLLPGTHRPLARRTLAQTPAVRSMTAASAGACGRPSRPMGDKRAAEL